MVIRKLVSMLDGQTIRFQYTSSLWTNHTISIYVLAMDKPYDFNIRPRLAELTSHGLRSSGTESASLMVMIGMYSLAFRWPHTNSIWTSDG